MDIMLLDEILSFNEKFVVDKKNMRLTLQTSFRISVPLYLLAWIRDSLNFYQKH